TGVQTCALPIFDSMHVPLPIGLVRRTGPPRVVGHEGRTGEDASDVVERCSLDLGPRLQRCYEVRSVHSVRHRDGDPSPPDLADLVRIRVEAPSTRSGDEFDEHSILGVLATVFANL